MKNKDNITVYNQTPFSVYAKGKLENYTFESADKDFCLLDMPLSEIDYLNKTTNVFKDGILTVADEDKKAVFEEIGLKNWEDILSRKEIIDILENPTNTKLQKIVNIQSKLMFDRVRVELVGLLSIDANILTKVVRIIDQRYDEIMQNKLVSDIAITLPQAEPTQREIELEKQLKEMQKQIEKLTAIQAKQKTTITKANTDIKETKEDTDTKETKEDTDKPVKKTTTKKTEDK